MLSYSLNLPIQPQPDEHSPEVTARNIWTALGRPSVTVVWLPTAPDPVPVFRFSTLSRQDMYAVAKWYNPDEAETLMLDVRVHET